MLAMASSVTLAFLSLLIAASIVSILIAAEQFGTPFLTALSCEDVRDPFVSRQNFSSCLSAGFRLKYGQQFCLLKRGEQTWGGKRKSQVRCRSLKFAIPLKL